MDAVAFARRCLRFEPDAKQQEVLLAAGPRTIVNTSRMWGKSTMAAVKALHWAWTKPRQTVALVSARRADSVDLMRLTRKLARELGVAGKAGSSLELGRGSQIVARAGGDGPVAGADLTIVDDAARVSDEAFAALRPAAAMGKGPLLLLSTPRDHSGFFYQIWEQDRSDAWVKIQATAEEGGRLPEEFLEEERKRLGEIPFWKTYMCNYDDEKVRPKIYAGWVDEIGGEFMDGPWGYEEEYWKDREMPEGHTLKKEWTARAEAKARAEAEAQAINDGQDR
jgi:hypothetical protein